MAVTEIPIMKHEKMMSEGPRSSFSAPGGSSGAPDSESDILAVRRTRGFSY